MLMVQRGPLKLVGAAKPDAVREDSFMASLKEIEAMERHRIARLVEDEQSRAEHARVLCEQAAQNLRADEARAQAEARAADQLLELRAREAAAVVAAKTTALVEIEKIGAEARLRLEEMGTKRKHELAMETLRLSSKSAAVTRSIAFAFAGALVVLVASVGIQLGVVAPAANARVAQLGAAIVEREKRIETLESDALASAAHTRSIESQRDAMRAELDAQKKTLADVVAKPPPKPSVRNAGAAQPRGAVDYGMPLCPPGVTWDPMCIANPKK
jgi:hypothetical protein